MFFEEDRKGPALPTGILGKSLSEIADELYLVGKPKADANGTDIFEGGFLVSIISACSIETKCPRESKKLQQADATSWMAMYILSICYASPWSWLSTTWLMRNPPPNSTVIFNIGWAMHHIGKKDISLWDEYFFYYDAIQFENGKSERLKIRSMVGIIPLLAVEIMHNKIFKRLNQFNTRLEVIKLTRPDSTRTASGIEHQNKDGNYLFGILVDDRLELVLKRLLDEAEFLSDYGIRSLSRTHKEQPYVFGYQGTNYSIQYEPGESSSSMFGGNSNWRGPIWLPLNYLIIHSLRKYYEYYGDEHQFEFPAGSGNKMNLKQIANQLTRRILRIFEKNEDGHFQYHAGHQQNWSKDHFKDHHLFYEFFHGDTGQGLGACHQTGWTALIVNLLLELDEE